MGKWTDVRYDDPCESSARALGRIPNRLMGSLYMFDFGNRVEGSAIALQASLLSGGTKGYSHVAACPKASGCFPAFFDWSLGCLSGTKFLCS